MAYSQSLADRVRRALGGRRDVAEKKMFGGVGFLLGGNLLVCVWQTSLIVRLGAEAYDAALREPHVREFDVTGRPMRGWVMVEPDGLDADDALAAWIDRAFTFVTTLPPKR
jgi:hypothetical protein